MTRGYGKAGLAAASVALAGALFAGDFPAARPDGGAPGAGSQKLAVDALHHAHMEFSGDACLAGIDALLFRTLDPKLPSEDDFDFTFRSPSLRKMAWEAKVCLPYGPSAPPQCRGGWDVAQRRVSGKPRCLGRPIDTEEALLSARRRGLPPPPIDGMRLSLRLVPKRGRGLARHSILRGRLVWLIESREQCHAVDARTAEHLLKASCKSLGME